MTHRAGSPRWLLPWERVTSTQRLTFAAAFGCDVACVVGLGVGEAVARGLEADGVGWG